ncbi:protein misato homolog 1 [Nematostella vectensis]|uniref:protein misato homolog 1 n=1 Tax=Nematostella vectensis TaxID=45351 RepID=UPI0020774996|nr:protein misato homolog 1 [Nematostella vectensis]
MADATVREVITLQFGHYANFVGTHWWNIQESSFCYDAASPKSEINHDCLFREGLTVTGQETYTPRLLLYDLKGSLRNLSTEGLLYEGPSKKYVDWEGEITIYETNPDQKNEFQADIEKTMVVESQESGMDSQTGDATEELSDKVYNLDDEIVVWSDFLGTQLHPRSVNIINEYSHDADMSPFSVYGYGQSLYNDESFRDNFEDGLRFFAEECDRLQGFQILADVHNGFGGLMSQCLEDLRDEYNSKSMITVGCVPAHFKDTDQEHNVKRILNMALSFSQITEHCDLFVPLCVSKQVWPKPGTYVTFPYLNYKGELPYHTSAILASALDTFSLPYRLDTPKGCGMRDLISTIAFSGRNIAHAHTMLPIPVGPQKSLASLLNDCIEKRPDSMLPLTPHINQSQKLISQAAVLRGIPQSLRHHPLGSPKAKSMFGSSKSSCDMLDMYFQSINPNSVIKNWTLDKAFGTKAPYPNIFNGSVGSDGLVSEGSDRGEGQAREVKETSVLSALGMCAGTGEMLESLITWSNKVDVRKHHEYLESGVEFDLYKEKIESLLSQANLYKNP